MHSPEKPYPATIDQKETEDSVTFTIQEGNIVFESAFIGKNAPDSAETIGRELIRMMLRNCVAACVTRNTMK